MVKGESKVCDDDDDNIFTYGDLVEMVSNLDDLLGDVKGKYKDLKTKYTSLQNSFEELKASHEDLKETHKKLREAHESHIAQEANKVKVEASVTCNLFECMPVKENVSKTSISTSCDDLLSIPCCSKVDACEKESLVSDPLLDH